MIQTNKRLDDAIHITRVADVFESDCWSQIHTKLREIFIIFAIKCLLTGIIVKGLIIGSALSCTIDDLITDTADSQRLFVLNALLAVSFDLMNGYLLSFQNLADLSYESMG